MTAPGEAAVDDCRSAFAPEVRERLTWLRSVILEHLPAGEQTVRHGMPAVMLGAAVCDRPAR